MIGALVGIAFLAGFIGGWPAVSVGVTGTVLSALSARRGLRLLPIIAIALMAGAWRAPDVDHEPLLSMQPKAERISGVISSAVVDDGKVQRFRFGAEGWTICARTFARTQLGRGDRLDVAVDLMESDLLPDSYRQYLRSQGCDASGTLGSIRVTSRGSGFMRSVDEVRQSVTRTIVAWVPGDRGALLAGLVIGDDALMSDDVTEAFGRTGTLHVVAVSGSNLALLASILVISYAFFTCRVLSEAIGLVIIWAYVLVGGAVPPTLRAGMLATMAAGSRVTGRPIDVLTLSIVVAAGQAAIWPASTLGLSYRLSTVAIFGVVVASAGRPLEGWLTGMRLVAVTTVVVNIAMLPILPAESRPDLLLSLVTNVAIAPLVSASFVLGVVAVVIGWLVAPVGQAVAILAGEINGLTLSIVTNLAEIERLPGPLDVSGNRTPGWVLLAFAILSLAGISTEFRRWVKDSTNRTRLLTDQTADVAVGAALGILCATLGIALLR